MKKQKKKKKSEKKNCFGARLTIVACFMFFAVCAILFRAFHLQAVENEKLAKSASKEIHQTVTQVSTRGVILEKNGMSLAVSTNEDSVYVNPEKFQITRENIKNLAEATGLEYQEVKKKVNSKKPFVWVRRHLKPEQSKKIVNLKLAGVGIIPENHRNYPKKSLAAHIIGFAGLDSQGLEGIERKYDDLLSAKKTRVIVKRDARGKFIHVDDRQERKVQDGNDIKLTIDINVQNITEMALQKAVNKTGAKGGMAVVMEVKTGKILSSAVWPTFNPNIYASYPEEVRRNKVITDPFEPGSVMKIFTLAKALEENLYNPFDVIDCGNGRARIGGRFIHDVHRFKELNFGEVLIHSSNIGAARIGLNLGAERLSEGLETFGFGKPTGVDLLGESSGLMRSCSNWRTIDLANISFGHGVAVTAMQLVSAIAAVANDGILMRPYIVDKVINDKGEIIQKNIPVKKRRVISRNTAKIIKNLMAKVVSDEGTGKLAEPTGYTAAGKTGTAQKIDKKTGRYSKEKYRASFGGFAPVENPEIAVLVVIDEPQTSIYGSQTAAPAFAEIVSSSLPFLEIPAQNPEWIIASSDNKKNNKYRSDLKEDLLKKSNLNEIPRLTGLSLRKALAITNSLGVGIVVVDGSGYVFEQTPAPGEKLQGVKKIVLRLKAGVS